MLIKSYAKINLSLTITKKIRKKRLHDIQSQFCLINLFDKISIKKNKKKSIKQICIRHESSIYSLIFFNGVSSFIF